MELNETDNINLSMDEHVLSKKKVPTEYGVCSGFRETIWTSSRPDHLRASGSNLIRTTEILKRLSRPLNLGTPKTFTRC